MKQGWTVTVLLIDNPMRLEDPTDRKDLDKLVNEWLTQLPANLTFQRFYVYKHKSKVK
jgi:hypothetical protein